MSNNKSNYNKMYNTDAGKRVETKPVDEAIPKEVKPVVEETIVETVVESKPEPTPVKMETVVQPKKDNVKPVESKPQPKPAIGVVTCEYLNVRVAPNKEALVETVISKESQVTIDNSGSTNGWYKVTTNDGHKGYCMKKFISVR